MRRLGCLAVMLFSIASSALAHGSNNGSIANAGIEIPAISHGEMAAMDRYYGRIIGAASRVENGGDRFRRLLNYTQIQYAYCLWGKMPGSITDEESPFNQCAHAYLAAAKALLLTLRALPERPATVDEILSELDSYMALNGLALINCQFGGVQFSTGAVIVPGLMGIVAHRESALTFLGILAISLLLIRTFARGSPNRAEV